MRQQLVGLDATRPVVSSSWTHSFLKKTPERSDGFDLMEVPEKYYGKWEGLDLRMRESWVRAGNVGAHGQDHHEAKMRD